MNECEIIFLFFTLWTRTFMFDLAVGGFIFTVNMKVDRMPRYYISNT